ncbi:hypothetical protein K491DRAFT_684428 [Lophiostoma macrostomum CBS 122681]|uniref:Uncharacterized protein n=1 Tax=Lophiostoma macrostomum CBS 122681 TaxID=1314788 RepID=A0A6A6SQ57_9PLEO|nr:hypothetical protein K491DRAFT_684428 [Lophiostoma macrostomum CBS 122681]
MATSVPGNSEISGACSRSVTLLPADRSSVYNQEEYDELMKPFPKNTPQSIHPTSKPAVAHIISTREQVRERFTESLGMLKRVTDGIVQQEIALDKANNYMSRSLAAALRNDEHFQDWRQSKKQPLIKLDLPDTLPDQASLVTLIDNGYDVKNSVHDRMLQFHCPKGYTGYTAGQNCLLRKLLADGIPRNTGYLPLRPSEWTYSTRLLLDQFRRCLEGFPGGTNILIIIHGLSEYIKDNEDETKQTMDFLVNIVTKKREFLAPNLKVLLTSPIPVAIEGLENFPTVTFEA